jgi:hypothetical protein
MPKGLTSREAPPAMSTFPPKPEIAMVMSPSLVEPLDSLPWLATTSQTNELANFVPPYQTVVHSIPPIPPMGTGIPCSPVPNYYFNKYGTPDRIPRTEPGRVLINSFEECLAAIREYF